MFLLICNMQAAQDIRPLAHSGRYYPKPGKDLKKSIKPLFEKVRALPGPKPRMIITPHDQLTRSGLTAAIAYQALRGHSYESIFLIGPYHADMIHGISIWDLGNWQGPQGVLELDRKMVTHLKTASKALQQHVPHLHFPEHSLENQLPFLQEVLVHPHIVPILISHNAYAHDLARAILEIIKGRDILIVISTDLSHAHPLAEANLIDLHTLTFINTRNYQGLNQAIDDLQVELCGSAPVLTGLEIASQMNWQPQILHYATNADIIQRKDAVVGYAAIAFFEE